MVVVVVDQSKVAQVVYWRQPLPPPEMLNYLFPPVCLSSVGSETAPWLEQQRSW